MISIKNYLEQTQDLLDKNEYTDGCSLSQFMHKVLSKAKLLCAAHDFGNLGKVDGIRPGLMNQFYSLAAHMLNLNPFYWIWGMVIFVMTMPWIIWRREIKITFLRSDMFFGIQLVVMVFLTIYYFTQ